MNFDNKLFFFYSDIFKTKSKRKTIFHVRSERSIKIEKPFYYYFFFNNVSEINEVWGREIFKRKKF